MKLWNSFFDARPGRFGAHHIWVQPRSGRDREPHVMGRSEGEREDRIIPGLPRRFRGGYTVLLRASRRNVSAIYYDDNTTYGLIHTVFR
jgi:hypothetical protein